MNGMIVRRAVKCGNSAHVMLPIGWRNRPVVVIDKRTLWGQITELRRRVKNLEARK